MEEKIRECIIADKILKIAEKDIQLAEKISSEIKYSSAKVQAFLNLYSFSLNEKYLQKAIESASCDEDYLRIVEKSLREDMVDLIKDKYKKDLAYSFLLEKTNNLNFAAKISDRRLLSAAMKRLCEKMNYPENLKIARMIPEEYYRCLALVGIEEKEKIGLEKEIEQCINSVENLNMRKWLADLWKRKKN
ncbi:MAG: hypothetical protein QFX40_01935 [Archaeoglobales archaeon]|nr:hypothetical protein [Archaeoglobales archaeon]